MEASTPELLLKWLLAALATYRLTYLITIDNGPAHIFARLRSAISEHYGPGTWQAEAAECFFCQSVWYAAGAAALLQPEGIADYFIFWLSIAGACAVLHWKVLTYMASVNR